MAILTFRSFAMPGERSENESNNLAACFPLRTAEDEQLHQVKRMIRGVGHVVLDLFSNLKFVRSSGYFW